MSFRLDIVRCPPGANVSDELHQALEGYRDLFPRRKDAKIILKPNLNSNMNALTGNTTDLRILGALIQFLKKEHYTDIAIAEGTNSGFYRNKIGVTSRLKVDKLAAHYGVRTLDLNYAEPHPITFEDGIVPHIAKACTDADFLINVPKLKTHFEMGMSVCLKNLMGCLIGQENKKHTHKALAKNILHINKHLKPHLHVVDALFAMEGLGPTRGTPVNMGCIILGTDPYLIDLVCAKIARFDYRKVKTLERAEEEGLLTPAHHTFVSSIDVSDISRKFLEPKANPFAAFIHSPKRQRHFLAIRNTAFFNYLCSTRIFGKILFLTGLRQDNFIKKDMIFEGLEYVEERCVDGCTKCASYCPVELELPKYFLNGDSGCIECLYCYLVCPTKAIEFRGELGFFADQLEQYEEITRRIA